MSRRRRVHEFELPAAVLGFLVEYLGRRRVAKLTPTQREELAVQAQVFTGAILKIVDGEEPGPLSIPLSTRSVDARPK